jgi:hypothetical protein
MQRSPWRDSRRQAQALPARTGSSHARGDLERDGRKRSVRAGNTAIFSFLDSILLRSLPVDHPERLVILSFWTNKNEIHGMNMHDDSFLPAKTGYSGSFFSYPAFAMFQSNGGIFSDVFGYQGAGNLHFAAGDRAEVARTEYVTGNYFQALGVPPVAGRLVMRDDDRAGASPVAVISYAFSRRRFGSAQKMLLASPS